MSRRSERREDEEDEEDCGYLKSQAASSGDHVTPESAPNSPADIGMSQRCLLFIHYIRYNITCITYGYRVQSWKMKGCIQAISVPCIAQCMA
jgi:hypothetical protein